MGKKLNLSHLTQEECDQIMNVLQKDFEIRRAEQQRISEVHQELVKEQSRVALLREKEKFNETSCIACLERFGILFRRKRKCYRCKLNVCSSCSQPMKEKKEGFICNVCSKEKAYKMLSNQWFYNDSPVSGDEYSGSSKVVRYLYKRNTSSTPDVNSGHIQSSVGSEIHGQPRPRSDNISDLSYPNIEDQDLNKETFDRMRRAEEFNFGVKFDRLLDDLRLATEDNSEDGLTTSFASTSYGEVMLSFKEKLKELVGGFLQRLLLAYESCGITEPAQSLDLRAKRDVSQFVEHFIGDHLDVISEVLCDSPLQLQDSSDDQSLFADLLAQAVVSKLLENHCQEVSGTLQPSDNRLTKSRLKDKNNILHNKTDLRNQRATSDDNLSYGSDLAPDDADNYSEVNSHSKIGRAKSESDISGRNNSRHKRKTNSDRSANNKHEKLYVPSAKSKSDDTINSAEENDISDGESEFDQLKEFVKKSQSSRKSKIQAIAFDDSGLQEVREETFVKNEVERDEERENFQTRYSVFDRVHNSKSVLPDFSENYSNDLALDETDPDLLSLNLAIIPEETEEDLEQDDVRNKQNRWKTNWIFKGKSISPYENIGKKKVGLDSESPLYMMVPRPEASHHPRIGSRDIDQLSDYLDNSHSDFDVSDEEENAFYADTSKELAIIAGQRRAGHTPQLTSRHSDDSDIDGRIFKENSVQYIGRKTLGNDDINDSSNHVTDNGPFVEPNMNDIKLLRDLIPAENNDPSFLAAPESITVQEGEPLRFSCRVTGTGPVDVFWYHEGDQVEELEDSEDVEIFSSEDMHSIVIYNISKKMAGQYVCIAVNEKGKTIQYLVVTVKDNKQELKKPEFLKGIKDVEVTEGQSVYFRVKVKGYPPPRISWYKDGMLLKSSRSCRIEKFGNRDYTLTVNSASMNDDAEYTVLARNIAGVQKLSAQVIVEPKSDMPARRQTLMSSTTSGVSDSDSDWSASNRSLMSAANSSTAKPPFTPATSLLPETSSSLSVHGESPAQQKEDQHCTRYLDRDVASSLKLAQCGTPPAKRLITENMLDVLKMAEDIMQHENNTSVHTIKQAVTRNMPQYSSNDGQHNDQLTSVQHQKASTDSLLQELDLPDSLDDSSLSSLQSKYSTQSKSSFDSDLNDDYQRKQQALKNQYSRDFEVRQMTESRKWSVTNESLSAQAKGVNGQSGRKDDKGDNSTQSSFQLQSLDFDVPASSGLEQYLPAQTVKYTKEEDELGSQADFRTDCSNELPSVNKLTAIFSSMQDDDDYLGSSSLNRVHSITARSVPREQLEKLRASAESQPSSALSGKCLEVPDSLSASPQILSTSQQQQSNDMESASLAILRSVSSSSETDPVYHQQTQRISQRGEIKILDFDKEPVLIYPLTDPEYKQQHHWQEQQHHWQEQQHHQQKQQQPRAVPSPKPRKSCLSHQENQQHSPVNQSPTVTTEQAVTSPPRLKTQAHQSQDVAQSNADNTSHKHGVASIRGGSIMARAAFWERKMLRGEDVQNEEFPEIM